MITLYMIANMEFEIEAKMIESSSDFEQLQKLSIEKDSLEKELDHAIARWTYLNDLFEEIEKNKK